MKTTEKIRRIIKIMNPNEYRIESNFGNEFDHYIYLKYNVARLRTLSGKDQLHFEKLLMKICRGKAKFFITKVLE